MLFRLAAASAPTVAAAVATAEGSRGAVRSCAVLSSYPSRRDNLTKSDPPAAGETKVNLPGPGRSWFCGRVEVSAREHTGNGEQRAGNTGEKCIRWVYLAGAAKVYLAA